MTVEATLDDTNRPSQSEFGFWLYLMSDAILFGLLFATFVIMAHNTAGGPSGADLFSLKNLSIETALLLTSTLTIALGHQATSQRKTQTAILWIVLTCILGGSFVLLELTELIGMIHQDAGPDRSGFLSAFFTLVGTHGLHVTAGILWAITMIVQLIFKGPTPAVASRLLRLTLFWHFLDIVWIGVFSAVYLPGVMG